MKQLMSFCLGAALLAGGLAQAGERTSRTRISPTGLLLATSTRLIVKDYEPPPAPAAIVPPAPYDPVPMPDPGVKAGGQPVPLSSVSYPMATCVKVRDARNIAPCAVTMIVLVKDPCAVKDQCAPCAAPGCVAVKICVPSCGCPKICCKRDGERVTYDYGEYKVDITSRRGVVVVDYDD